MKHISRGFLVLTLTVSGPSVFANWQDWTVWASNQASENSIIGTVKTIALNHEQDRLVAKIQLASGEVEKVLICEGNIQSARNQADVTVGMPVLTTLQNAMANGQQVQLNYASAFDRCIQSVSVVAPAAKTTAL